MAMPAVRQLKAKTAEAPLAAVPEPPSLAGRLAEARKAAEPLAARVAELERAKADAIAREDGAELDQIKDELTQAREASAVAAGTVAGLGAALADVQRRQAEDGQAVQIQRQRDDARRRLAEARRLEAEALSELDAEVEAMWAAVAAVKLSFRRGQQLEDDAGRARSEQNLARAVLGEAPPGLRATAPNRMSAALEYVPALQAVLKCSRP